MGRARRGFSTATPMNDAAERSSMADDEPGDETPRVDADGVAGSPDGTGATVIDGLPTRPLSASEWTTLAEEIEFGESVPIGFYGHNGAVTHFIARTDGATRVVGWNPDRRAWIVIVAADPRDDGMFDLVVDELPEDDERASITFDRDAPFEAALVEFVDAYIERTFEREVTPVLPSEALSADA